MLPWLTWWLSPSARWHSDAEIVYVCPVLKKEVNHNVASA
jgi:hypothetical protein